MHYQPLHERFARYCRTKAMGTMEPADLAQEAVLAALENYDRLRDKGKLLSYLIGTVNHLVSNQRRQQKRAVDWDAAAVSDLASRLPDPALLADIRLLLKAIQQLPPHEQEALELFELSGFSVREVADIQGVSEGAVKTRLSRARARLKTLLAEDGRPMTLAQRLSIYVSILL